MRIKQLESDITYLIAKQERELILAVNNAAYHGDLNHLKGLINAGADPSKTDYDGRTALVRPFILNNLKVLIIFCNNTSIVFFSQNKLHLFISSFCKLARRYVQRVRRDCQVPDTTRHECQLCRYENTNSNFFFPFFSSVEYIILGYPNNPN